MRKVGLLAFVVLSSCMANHPAVRPLRPLEIATAPYQPLVTTALTGTLMYEGDCLLFRDDHSGMILMPVWPSGSSFNGTALLYHLPGKSDQWVTVTQEVQLSGQPIGWTTLGGLPYQPLQRQCGAYQPFFVSQVRPAD
jgi:hypothetical protein